MEDIGLVKQGWKWAQSQKHWCSGAAAAAAAAGCLRDKIGVFIERHWPMVCSGCARFGRLLLLVLIHWKHCVLRGFNSLLKLGSAALLLIIWSCFLSLTSLSCLFYVLLSMGAAGAAVQYLGYTPGLFIVGLFAILILWMYANFWITGTLFIVGGYLFSLNHARLVVLMATMYAIYCVKIRVGWHGVILSINLTFLSNDVLNFLLQWCDNLSESTHYEEQKESESIMEDEFCAESKFSVPVDESEKLQSCKSSSKPTDNSSVVNNQKEPSAPKVIGDEMNSADEMKRILNSSDHYEALGFVRHKRIDVTILKKEYRKKAMLVHPDKNMGSPLASESFKKLQCAYEVLSDSVKKRDYDEQLRKEESRQRSVCQKSYSSSPHNTNAFMYRTIQIIGLRNQDVYSAPSVAIHIYGCVPIGARPRQDGARTAANIIKPRMEMDGLNTKAHWSLIDLRRSKFHELLFVRRAKSLMFQNGLFVRLNLQPEKDSLQGMACRPNTHRPSFHVNMVGLEKTQRSNSNRYPWDLDAEMMDEDEDQFEMWLQQALASGLFCETSKRRKSWSPFKLHQKKGKKQWRRSST
ncbi:hypothetical protein Tsubulata_010697 [Turnera subulata]|uniref:J domain-containing protein n=1 Tax=Turnera subulata TaxID=218843 RepID=A0A9Q0FT31_9ROSI|nr:hypothetical protein Tsubulata_010697 [Turnera subulata]